MHSERDILKASKNNKERIKMTPFIVLDIFSGILTIMAVYIFCKCLFESNFKITIAISLVIFWFCSAVYFDCEHAKESSNSNLKNNFTNIYQRKN
jgi:heme/copper-type cytochrome/quinol oxidase subunit 4